MKPVYVIVPVYNTDQILLNKCINSVLAQTYSNVYLVCVDDGSNKAETLETIRCFKNNGRFILLTKKNGGVGSARNTGLAYVEQFPESYVTFLDSDDYLGINYINSLVYQLESDNTDAIFSNYTVQKDGADYIWDNRVNHRQLSSFEAVKETVIGRISPNPFAKLYKTGKIFGGGWFRYDESLFIGEDVAFTFRTFINADSVSFSKCAEYYFNRYIHYSSLSRQKWNNKKCLSVFKCDRLRAEFVCSTFSEDENRTIMRMLRNDCADNYLGIFPRFDIKNANEHEKQELRDYQKFIVKEKLIWNFEPYSSKTKVKKYLYIYARPWYRTVYKLFLK